MATPLQTALNTIGREQGPDFIISVTPPAAAAAATVTDVISSDSGISEILNIIAFLANPAASRVAGTIDVTRSIPANTVGTEHDNNTFDVGAGDLAGNNGGTLFAAAGNTPFITLNDFTVAGTGVATNQIIPQGILKRRGGSAVPGYDFTDGCPNSANRTLVGVLAGGAMDGNTITLFSKCVKQMINILIKVREIFGPQGWTALFSRIKSGGGTGKTHAKRTHRRHRRRYSSKQY